MNKYLKLILKLVCFEYLNEENVGILNISGVLDIFN